MSASRALAGKVALVTGGGRGIGRATALALARRGADIAVCARTQHEIEVVAAEIEGEGSRALAVVADIAVEDEIAAVVDRVRSALGPVDILVNNAGTIAFAPIAETRTETWDRLMAVNLRATFLFCRAVWPEMVARGGGTIVNVASTAGHRGYPRQGAYVASKHGVVGLSKVLAIEGQAHGVRVHVVSPGGVDTALTREWRDDVDFEEFIEPDQVAEVIAFLACQGGQGTIDEIVLRRYQAEPWR